MGESRVDHQFPGFQTYSHRDEFEFRKCISRLQKIAPCPLQVIKPNAIISSASCTSNHPQDSSSSSSSSSDSMFSGRDPIPLLSPLVILVQPPCCMREDNSAKSH